MNNETLNKLFEENKITYEEYQNLGAAVNIALRHDDEYERYNRLKHVVDYVNSDQFKANPYFGYGCLAAIRDMDDIKYLWKQSTGAGHSSLHHALMLVAFERKYIKGDWE